MLDTVNTISQEVKVIIKRAEQAVHVTKDSDVDYYLALIDDTYIGLDLETSSLSPYGTYHKTPTGWKNLSFIRLVTLEGNDRCVMFDLFHLSKESQDKICEFITDPEKTLVIMNAKFDLKWMMAILGIERFNRVFCTMLASQVIGAGKTSWGHALKNIVKNYFDYDMDKELGASNWGVPTLSPEQLFYAALDACFLKPVMGYQVNDIKRLRVEEAAEIEFNCVEVVAYMENCGMRLNVDRWLRTAKRNKLRAIRLYPKISKLLETNLPNTQPMLIPDVPHFKITSHKQLGEAMKMAGIILPTITKKGVDKETTQIEYLEKIKDTHPAIPTIIKHNILEHAHTSFGQTWADFVNPLTERIHPDIFQIGTETYRFSFKNPNFQQIPTENLYRNCFIPNPGNKLIGGDYNGMELRIIAEASQDSQMIMAFNKGLDLHTYTASIIFSIPYEKMIEVLSNKSVKDYIQYKLYRTRAKNLNFGIVYGIGAKRFAANAGITEKEAYKIIDDYFALYKGLKMWLDWAKQQARYDWESRSLAGRLYRHTHKKDDEFWKISAAERLGCNFPIQATNADITKIALRNLYDEFGRKIKIVNCIHDEILIECAEKNAKKFQPIFDRCMIAAGEVYIKSVPVLVESEIMDRWSK